ncbi:MAG: aldehyde reductase [Chloroflexi bacterium]|nr:aldehyde reductase [Chloroflexota bacterium]OJW02632.1 MAG: epimerase [Chloroflexi bacterium 54-19]
MSKTVLVTGGSGFIAGYCILQLLEQGYQVRTTVRSPGREVAIRDLLKEIGQQPGTALSFVVADLTSDAGWPEAVAGCDYVLHVASPLPLTTPKNDDELIIPAREGTLRVLRTARDAGVKRVVLTSAFMAVGYGYPHTDRLFTEDDWTITDGPGVSVYGKSKTLAERAAWDFMAAEGGSMELTTIIPVAVLGPVLGKEVTGSNELVRRLLDGALPGYPDFYMPIVDVRDVANAHLLAMTAPAAANQRFITSSGAAFSMKQVGTILKGHFGEKARRVPKRSIPNFVLRFAALFDHTVREIAPDLGYARKMTSEKAHRLLGWQPRKPEIAIIETAESMIKKGLVKA